MKEKEECPECKGKIFIYDEKRGERICRKCGLVIEDMIIQEREEWRAFDQEQKEKKVRTGPPLKPGEKLTTVIWGSKDSYGFPISTKQKEIITRIKRLQRTESEEKLELVLNIIQEVIAKLSLPREIRERAILIYKECQKKNILKGKKGKIIAVSSVYAACKQLSIPVTIHDIAKASKLPERKIERFYKFIVKELSLKIPPTLPDIYIERLRTELKLSDNVKIKSLEILEDERIKNIINGKNPITIATAIIYIASILSNEPVTQRKLAKVSGVTEVTIRNRYKEICKKLELSL